MEVHEEAATTGCGAHEPAAHPTSTSAPLASKRSLSSAEQQPSPTMAARSTPSRAHQHKRSKCAAEQAILERGEAEAATNGAQPLQPGLHIFLGKGSAHVPRLHLSYVPNQSLDGPGALPPADLRCKVVRGASHDDAHHDAIPVPAPDAAFAALTVSCDSADGARDSCGDNNTQRRLERRASAAAQPPRDPSDAGHALCDASDAVDAGADDGSAAAGDPTLAGPRDGLWGQRIRVTGASAGCGDLPAPLFSGTWSCAGVRPLAVHNPELHRTPRSKPRTLPPNSNPTTLHTAAHTDTDAPPLKTRKPTLRSLDLSSPRYVRGRGTGAAGANGAATDVRRVLSILSPVTNTTNNLNNNNNNCLPEGLSVRPVMAPPPGEVVCGMHDDGDGDMQRVGSSGSLASRDAQPTASGSAADACDGCDHDHDDDVAFDEDDNECDGMMHDEDSVNEHVSQLEGELAEARGAHQAEVAALGARIEELMRESQERADAAASADAAAQAASARAVDAEGRAGEAEKRAGEEGKRAAEAAARAAEAATQRDQLRVALERLSAHVMTLQLQIQEQQKEAAQRSAEASANTSAAAATAACGGSLSDVNSEMSELRERVSELQSEVDTLRGENKYLQEKIDELSDERDLLRASEGALRKSKDKDRAQISQYKQALRNEHSIKEHMAGRVRELEERNNELDARVQQLIANGGRAGPGGAGPRVRGGDGAVAAAAAGAPVATVLDFADVPMTIATPENEVQ